LHIAEVALLALKQNLIHMQFFVYFVVVVEASTSHILHDVLLAE
jgi:hypothetical protein